MYLKKLVIDDFRNIKHTILELHPKCNVFFGINGSGKTSVLEAIHYLSTLKSFRSNLSSRIINHEKDKLNLFAEIVYENNHDLSNKLGIERCNNGNAKIHFNANTVNSIAEITSFLPIQVIHQNSFVLLASGPKYKRQFVDWGMFHVEHSFMSAWKNYKRALEQRNATLKNKQLMLNKENITIWHQELNKWGIILNSFRHNYIQRLIPLVNDLLAELLETYQINIKYYSGWNEHHDLLFVLEEHLKQDQILGFTQYGPHRFDLRIMIDNIPIQDVLSRGQQKTFIFILYLAQNILLKQLTNKSCLVLIDDLTAELDITKQTQLFTKLQQLDSQIFITTLDKQISQYISTIFSHDAFEVNNGTFQKQHINF